MEMIISIIVLELVKSKKNYLMVILGLKLNLLTN